MSLTCNRANGRTHLEERFRCRELAGGDVDGHQVTCEFDVEQLTAIPPPGRLAAPAVDTRTALPGPGRGERKPPTPWSRPSGRRPKATTPSPKPPTASYLPFGEMRYNPSRPPVWDSSFGPFPRDPSKSSRTLLSSGYVHELACGRDGMFRVTCRYRHTVDQRLGLSRQF